MKLGDRVVLTRKGKDKTVGTWGDVGDDKGKFIGAHMMFPCSNHPKFTGEYWVHWDSGIVSSYPLSYLKSSSTNFFKNLMKKLC